MTDLSESRKRAYHYIVEQAKKANWDITSKSHGKMADICHISLDDLERLKGGRSAPSQELVVAFKTLFGHIANEIDEHLVTSFLLRT